MSDPGTLWANPNQQSSSGLPASDECVVLAILIGDSNSGGNATLSAGLSAELALSPGVPQPGAFLYDKWINFRTSRADEGGNAFIAMPANNGMSTTLANPAYGLAQGLRARSATLTEDRLPAPVYVVQLCSSFCSLGRETANANTSWAEQMTLTTGVSTDTLRPLLTEFYLRPAVTDLLALGKKVFVAGVYCLSLGGDCADPRQRFAGFPLTERGLAAQYGPSAANLRDAIGARIGLTYDPHGMPMYWCEPPAVGQLTTSGHRLSLGVNRNKMVASLRQQADTDAWFSFIEFGAHLRRGTDQLHYTDRALMTLGRSATTAASKLLPLVEITSIP